MKSAEESDNVVMMSIDLLQSKKKSSELILETFPFLMLYLAI